MEDVSKAASLRGIADADTISAVEGLLDEADKTGHAVTIGTETPTADTAPDRHASTPVRQTAPFAPPCTSGTSGIRATHLYSTAQPYACGVPQPIELQCNQTAGITGTHIPSTAFNVVPNLANATTFPYTSNTNGMTTMLPNLTSNINTVSAISSSQPFSAYTSMHNFHSLPTSVASGFSHPNVNPNLNMPYGGYPTVTNPYSYSTTADLNLTAAHIASRQVLSKDLPTFTGRPEDWPVFITNYEQSTIRCGFTDQENLIRLQKCLKGQALEAVRGRLKVPSTVGLAINTLRMLYGRPDVIHQVMLRRLREEPSVKPDKLETLVTFSLAVQNYRATMQAVGLNDYLNDPVLLNELVAKLPCTQRLSWGQQCMSLRRADIAAFDDWLFGLAMCASQVTSIQISAIASCNSNVEAKKGNRESLKDRIMIHDVVAKNNEQSEKSMNCLKCGASHTLSDCYEFRALSQSDRWKFVRENKLCLRCFKSHFIRRCNSKRCCGVDDCRMAHHPLLHNGTSLANKEQATLYHELGTAANKETEIPLFRYVEVILHSGTKSIRTFALIDEGASCTLIESQLANEFDLDGPVESLCMRWTGEITQNEANSKFVNLHVSPITLPSQKYRLRNVRTVANLLLPQQSLFSSTISKHAHIKGLPIRPYNKARARILIGLDNAKIGIPIEIREDRGSNLIAAKCRLGWSVYGRDKTNCAEQPRILHTCECDTTRDDRMDQQLKTYFSIDAIGSYAPIKPLISKDDERALQIMEKTTRFISAEKRWETGLLWKHEAVELPDSLPMAIRRLSCLESKMKRDSSIRQFLINKIHDYEKKGYVRKLNKNEIKYSARSWYLPIFTVLNANKKKTRLVWDAAARVKGVGLNDMLLKGPDLLKSLLGVLLRFRERRFAVCGDIREMFHQIKIIKEDQVAQKFLWRNDGPSRDYDIYVMRVMTFGASCSPSLANYIKNRNAHRFADLHPDAERAIVSSTFVDDWLQSADSENELARLATKVRWVHQEGGFQMRNWKSNSKHVLFSLDADDVPAAKCFEEPEAVIEKVLGMWWLPVSDELTYFENFPKEVFNENTIVLKRQILRTIMTIFDPMGLLGFVIVQAKIILQDVWRSGVGWDEPIKEEERCNWFRWVKRIPAINGIKIPRCLSLASENQNNQLHIFVDASIKAYAAMAYIRSEVGLQISCSLLASKTRVAPLKPTSIPRLEQLAAVLGLRLANVLSYELSITVNRRVFWTDSKNVWFWLRSSTRKYHQFVALRIGEILESSAIREWRWLPSGENIADEGTKWSSNREFDGNDRWFSGPKFLLERESSWPIIQFPDDDEETVEVLQHMDFANNSLGTNAEITPDVKRFSTWEKLRSAHRFVLRFLRLVTKGKPRSQFLQKLLNPDNIETAELAIMLNCQSEMFHEEICRLRNGEEINRKSFLFKFSPYLDQIGLLRVKGRIDAAEGVAINVKRPIILPRKHDVTRLLVDFYHRKFHHHHNEIVVNEMRQRFCISALKRLVKECAAKCQTCRNRRASPQPPQMGDLPMERVSPFTRPFTFTGVDYFGPMDVVIGRRREKRWGALFTCLTTRAVHIEISPTLSTESFLLIFKQFVSRRGVPKRIISDNGTNFRGASVLLVKEIERISSNDIERKYPEIEWIFIPPASPHMGGSWERMIRSTKSILMDILPDSGMREEVLRAVLADIENILNSRPLTYVPLDSAEDEALTPNHFLTGHSSGIRELTDNTNSGSALRQNFKISSQLADQFWRRWVKEYLPCLTRRAKWYQPPANPIKLNDVVVIVDKNSKRNSWPKGVVIDMNFGKDGQARSAVVKTVNGLCTRPIVKLAKLDVEVVKRGVNVMHKTA
ncbi:uncharacterized protein LOC129250308 [Anastrepha obliqua]|uniref:uncharacterized protein LOC129250308 n=1 Tax=Anastrepha obliqua TaxID=95512 RepID=UPI00240A1CE6|nr:uncharacterized protein LOC129250308 [Anastrepha obliqua]